MPLFAKILSTFVSMKRKAFISLFLALGLSFGLPFGLFGSEPPAAQSAYSDTSAADSQTSAGAPFFREFRPMYFIGGVPLQGPVDKTTAGFKFQFSTAISIWSGISGHEGLDLFFGYTQLSIWDFFDESSPFRDNSFMPGFYLSVPLRSGSLQRSTLLLGMEHRSNGRPMRGTLGDTYSRSTNYLFGEYGAFFSSGLVLKANLRAGFGWYDEGFTQEVFWGFQGYADLTAGYSKGPWQAAATVTPVFGPFNVNVDAWIARRFGICSVFAQFNYGYGEALSDWVRGYRPAPFLRFGILFGNPFTL